MGYISVSSPIDIGHKSGSDGYIAGRQMAFMIAELQARGQIAKSGLQTLQERYLGMSRDQVDNSMTPGAAIEQAAAAVADGDLDAELAKLGVDKSVYESKPADEKRAVFTREFQQKIRINLKPK